MINNLLEQLNSDYRRINKMMCDKGVYTEEVTGKQYFTGYEYKTLYDWDQYFESIVQLYLGWNTTLIKNGVTIFDNQQDNGFIWRSVPRCPGGQGDEHVKPFLAQIAMLVYKHEKNLDWIGHNYYERLKNILYTGLTPRTKIRIIFLYGTAHHIQVWIINTNAQDTGMIAFVRVLI